MYTYLERDHEKCTEVGAPDEAGVESEAEAAEVEGRDEQVLGGEEELQVGEWSLEGGHRELEEEGAEAEEEVELIGRYQYEWEKG